MVVCGAFAQMKSEYIGFVLHSGSAACDKESLASKEGRQATTITAPFQIRIRPSAMWGSLRFSATRLENAMGGARFASQHPPLATREETASNLQTMLELLKVGCYTLGESGLQADLPRTTGRHWINTHKKRVARLGHILLA